MIVDLILAELPKEKCYRGSWEGIVGLNDSDMGIKRNMIGFNGFFVFKMA